MAIEKSAYPFGQEMESSGAPPEDIEIVVVDPEAVSIATPDMEIVIAKDDPSRHSENLAEDIPDSDLMTLAGELITSFEADKNSRADWERTYISGLDLLGLKIEDKTTPWPGACGVYHPLLSEAVIRFQAQAIMEIFPAKGPVKTQIIGTMSDDKEKQAERVQNELNYLTTEKMPEYRAETESLLFQLPLAGSAFKKVYYDPARDVPVAMFVSAEDFVVPYGTSDLESCPRYTHVTKKYPNDIRKLQVSGFYRDVELPAPAVEQTNIQDKMDKITGSSSPGVAYDDRHTILEIHADLDLVGFECEDGVAKPYVIALDKGSKTVLSIRRNWVCGDSCFTKRQHFVQYTYLPGFGFYGTGLIHLVGGLAKSTTSILRQLIDAGTLSNLPAGLKSRGLRIKGDDSPIMPGEFRDVDVPGGAIKDSITFLPYKEPSQVLYQLLGNLVSEGRRIASVSDLPVGDSSPTAPVGTTLALMERAMKVMSAVQARLHASLRKELRLIADIVSEDMAPKYDAEGSDQFNRNEDFDGRVDVIPVSDANASTMSQRVVQYQAALQLAAQAPQMYDLPELHRQVLGTLGINGIDKIIPSSKEKRPTDPVSENMDILTGKPVKAYIYQDHEAHLAVHLAAAQDPKLASIVGQSPQANVIMASAAAHVSEHLAFQYRAEIEKQLGVALPPPHESLPEDVEVGLSRIVAEAAGRLLNKNMMDAKAAEAAKQAQDPLTIIQQQELAIRAADVKRKADKDVADAIARAEEARIKADLERERIAAQERIAGAKIGSEIAMIRQNISAQEKMAAERMRADQTRDALQAASRERVAGAKIGADVVKSVRNGSR